MNDSGGSRNRLAPSNRSAPETLGQPGREFLGRVHRAAMNVLVDSKTGREVLELCDDHAEARHMILDDRSSGLTVVAVVGATGQGKSWLMRQMIQNESVCNVIRSGNNASEATESLVWVGLKPTADLDARFEQYLHCKSSYMQSIGAFYILADAPVATDDRWAIAAVASHALSLASVLLVVVRRNQLRSQVIGALARASERTIVIPVVNAGRARDGQLESDVEAFVAAFVARMRQMAPTSAIVSPVMIDDFEVMKDRVESVVGLAAAESVATSLQSELGNSWHGDRRRSTRLAALGCSAINCPV